MVEFSKAQTPGQQPNSSGEDLRVPSISVRDLRKSFGDFEALRGINLDVHPGEAAVIIGPSGGGKSTLLRCLNLLEVPDSGTILRSGEPFGAWVDGTGNRHKANRKLLRQGRSRMPMVFQNFNLFQHMNALDNVVIGQRVVLGRSKAEAKKVAARVLERVGLGAKLHSYPAMLSGGQQQRVAIARALAMDPEVLLLDEPTSSLDPEMTGEVLAIIKGLAAEGMTMVVATHEMGLAKAIANNVIFVESGVVVTEGPPAQTLESPTNPRLREFLRAVVH